MSRAMLRRLVKLEAIRDMKQSGLVLIPWDQWPSNLEDPAWARIRATHPDGRIFAPGQAESLEAWEGFHE